MVAIADILRNAGRRAAPLIRDREGAAAVEIAIVFPVFMLILIGMITWGEVLWTQNSLAYAVAEAARCAATTPSTCGTTAQVQAYAASQAPAPGISASSFTYQTGTSGNCIASTGAAKYYQVNGTVTFSPLFGNMLPMFNITLTAMSCYPNAT